MWLALLFPSAWLAIIWSDITFIQYYIDFLKPKIAFYKDLLLDICTFFKVLGKKISDLYIYIKLIWVGILSPWVFHLLPMGNQKFKFLPQKKNKAINIFSLFRQANFKTSLRAIELLFRTVTGEDWNRVLHDCMFRPDCNIPPGANFWETDCGSSFLSIVYFCSFYVIITYIGKKDMPQKCRTSSCCKWCIGVWKWQHPDVYELYFCYWACKKNIF